MFIRPCDAGSDSEWRAFVATHGFGELVAAGRDRDLAVVVPTQFVLNGDEVLVHLVAGNPIWAAIDENPQVLLAVSGDWAYIPSVWKAIGDEDPRFGIPTTYYASVQLAGRATVLSEAEDVAALLRVQLAALQGDTDAVDPLEHGAKLAGIRGLRMSIESVRSKFKFGGNVDAAHRDAVVAHLVRRRGPGDLSAVDHAERRSIRST